MTNTNIYEKNWMNLVFEGRNKAYGAYQLREENSRTIIKSLFIALFLLTGVVAVPLTINYLEDPIIIAPEKGTEIILSKIFNNKPPVIKKAVAIPITKKSDPKKVNSLTNKITSTTKKIDDTPLSPTGNNSNSGSPTGTTTTTATTMGSTTGGLTPTLSTNIDGPETPIDISALDKSPEYPGGLNAFLGYVGKNFKVPEDEGLNVKVFVQFVVEINGELTDIKVIKDPGYGMGSEAIRVLKSLKTKWKPGIKNGKPVRTLYSLPITVTSPE